MKTKHAIISVLAILGLLLKSAHAINTVSIPILDEGFQVRVERFAKMPDDAGIGAKIICMVPLDGDLYVCTLNRIYKVDSKRQVSLYIDVEAAIAGATNRSLSTLNTAHGGLRSIAFHPRFRSNGLMYISAMETRPTRPQDFNYISDVPTPIPADSVVLEFKHDKALRRPQPSTYRLLFRVGMPEYDHPIKQIAFYRNFLYIAHGDGSAEATITRGGLANDALGKILRINPLKTRTAPYSIPRSNPFARSSTMKPEVYALGFRNPHHICFGRDGTLYSADAGRDSIEEVNIVLRGRNYGWSEREGTFVHLDTGGLLNGIAPLPSNDSLNQYEYPAAQVGHEGEPGDVFIGEAIAGACPVENGSPMSGNYYYSDFPRSGKFYYSGIRDLKRARTRGDPRQLTQARTKIASILFDHDNDPSTASIPFATLGDILRSEPGFSLSAGVNVRFGRGSLGEIYWSSKRNGQVYLFTSSLPSATS